MSLNDIRLTPQLLVALYPSVLIESIKKTADTGPATLGNNEKKILIVVNHAGAGVLPESELTFLSNILTACKLSLADVAIVNWNAVAEKAYKELLHRLESRFILLFALTPVQFGLPMDFPPFQIQAFDSRHYMQAPALPLIEGNKNLKLELWAALKKMFML